ncbi:MAG: zinc-dependent metalloprotease [Flavobacteriales bacterium CG_4_8_14_3_um_filter_35_10]|nr:MAG: zinc-dependent metalloprotease [Flavobacteriales bacterium CG_4_8_14_3_um_filter_35_10]PJA05187.1 MAG: zinc-dependent metalloprotease [Flavobacteriales bacterium CG_4_10_14_0_2_um_filter_35_18]
MILKFLSKALVFAMIFAVIGTVDAQKKEKKSKKGAVVPVAPAPKPKPKKEGILPYNEVVTKEFKTDEGLFKVHKNDAIYLFEIPVNLLEREMLMVTRIAKTATGIGFGGGEQNTQVLRWQRHDKNILLRVVSHDIVANDSLPIHEAVVNSNFEPILFSFPIKALSADSTAIVIDVTDLLSKDVPSIAMQNNDRKNLKISRLDDTRSYIERISSYPENIEFRHVKTYISSEPPSNPSMGSITLMFSNSMILLSETPMKRRMFDERVGWFTSSQTDYGLADQKTKTIEYLDRWRLEVKDEDIEKFKRGELVEPKKQIVYYIDRATPVQWRPYIKQGIEDWQVAFEAAGFKNAIIAKDPPTVEEDPDWSPEDVRYSVVRYLASPIPNANGPHVSDPRSGEILESDINWYHNVMTLLHNWFFVQTAAINPDAQKPGFKDDVMGRLIRFVSSHEVGHTLGLPHNMGSSPAYPVDSLRSASFTKKFGTAASIMDYARFNYIAQPGDKEVALMPNIGLYDKYAISWGYRPILDAKTPADEKQTLDSWILKHAGDPIYRFGQQQVGEVVDPSSQTEDLGDDAVKAGIYGIANLQRIVPNLIKWTAKDGKDYRDLKAIYQEVVGQFSRYMGHSASNIGGVYETYKTYDQSGAVYTFVPKSRQKKNMLFLQDQLFTTPKWLINKAIFDKIEYSGNIERIRSLQERTLNTLLDISRMGRLIENESINGAEAYTLLNMMDDLRLGIWSELASGKTIDIYRRNLQRAYIDRMRYLMTVDQQPKIMSFGRYTKGTKVTINQSDIRAAVRGELSTLKQAIKNALAKAPNRNTLYHLQDAIKRIDAILDPK